MQNYNWYSTKSQQRFQRTIIPEQRPSQYSDEGRFPLGSASDAESVELRDQLIESVSEETLQTWVDHRQEMRENCSLRKKKMGVEPNVVDELLRTYPKKKHFSDEDLDYETQGGSDGSQQSRIDYDRSKYVLNRKSNPISMKLSATDSFSSDQIFVDDSQPSTTSLRFIITGKENDIEKQVTSADARYQITRIPSSTVVEKIGSGINSGISESRSTLLVTIPATANSVQECILFKYGHCFAPKICPFTHNKSKRKEEGKITIMTDRQRKIHETSLCSSYVNHKNWNFDREDNQVI